MAQTLRMPLVVAANGALASLPQGGDADIAQSIGLLLATTPGDRRSVPDYGLPNPLGSGVEVDELLEVILDWEDRADPTYVEELADGIVQHLRVYPGSDSPRDTSPPRPPLVIGPRYSFGLGIDPDTGRVFIDDAFNPDVAALALKIDSDGRPYVETDPEPQALPVGVDGADDPFYDKD